MAKILVTGCAGFIGSHVAETLLKRGDTVIGVDDVNDYYSVEQKNQNLDILKKFEKFKFIKSDISNYDEMKTIFADNKLDRVIHLAARAGVRASIKNPHIYESTNLKGTLNLLDLARDNKIDKFVFASSSSVYGNRDKVPFSESDNVNHPISPYAATKKAGELLCYTYYHLYGMDIACLRFFTVYGPRGRPDMAPFKFVKWIYEGKQVKRFGDGTTKRDYTFVADIVKGIISASDVHKGYDIYNLGNSKPVELNHFISIIENLLGKKANINQQPKFPGDVDITYADISKAREKLGYNPETSIEEGMRQFIDWYKNECLLKNKEI